MNNPSAIVFDIARCSLHDGPGIRTTVFLKGCPLDCFWCHNPESKSYQPITTTDPKTGTTKLIGHSMTVAEVMAIVEKDMDYYAKSEGGLTISGGEPMTHPIFVKALAKSAKEKGIHVAIETSGMAPWPHFELVMPYIDLFLYDYKDSHGDRLRANTKGDLKQIEENCQRLLDLGQAVTRRCLIIPGINDSEAHLSAICALSLKHKPCYQAVDILLYHNLGQAKATNLGIPSTINNLRNLDNKKDIHRITQIIQGYPHKSIFLKGKLI